MRDWVSWPLIEVHMVKLHGMRRRPVNWTASCGNCREWMTLALLRPIPHQAVLSIWRSYVVAHVLRKTDVTLSNGVTVPANTFITAPINAVHYDDERYTNSEVFNPWRFFDLSEGEVKETPKHNYVTTSTDYLAFGHGKHACYVIPWYILVGGIN